MKALIRFGAALCCGLALVHAGAAEFPTRVVRVVVPFSAGGTADVLARLVSAKLQANLPQGVIVENRVGAGGDIGTVFVAQSPPDGYTLLLALDATMVVNPFTHANIQFDTLKDFATVTKLGEGRYSSPIQRWLAQAGRLAGIGVSTTRRVGFLSEVPTFIEQGLAGFEAVSWVGILVPAKTPNIIVQRLHADITAVLKEPDLRERFAAPGIEPVGNTPAEFTAQNRADLARWKEVVERGKIKAD